MKFGLDNKYVVVKLDDVEAFATEKQKRKFHKMLKRIGDSRMLIDKKPATNNYIVINQDEPYAGQVIKIMEDHKYRLLTDTNQLTGTPPLVVTSSTVVANLNVDKMDGYHIQEDYTVVLSRRDSLQAISKAKAKLRYFGEHSVAESLSGAEFYTQSNIINLNNTVMAHLTIRGENVLQEHYASCGHGWDEVIEQHAVYEQDGQHHGMYKFTLQELLYYFGPHMHMGSEPIFQEGIVYHDLMEPIDDVAENES